MKQTPNLISLLYRESFGRNLVTAGWSDVAGVRDRLLRARRFQLDVPMSAFLGELSMRAFVLKQISMLVRHKRLEALRVSALAPHQITWVEYDLRAAMSRSNELLGRYTPPEEIPQVEGWLIERHETSYSLHLFSWNTDPKEADEKGYTVWTFPACYSWTIDDTVPPWPSMITNSGEAATGVLGYDSTHVSISPSQLLGNRWRDKFQREMFENLLREWTGVLRRVWAFLACIDDIPVLTTPRPVSGGFLAKGRIRKYLECHTITINVPRKEQRALAARVLGSMVKRAGGPVRAHWRRDWRNPVSPTCPAFLATGVHLWTEEQACSECGGRRILVHEHVRGDTGVGFNVTDYIVKHVDNARP